MNSFNDIKKVKYSENQTSVIALDEYILFADERKHEKYVVFKFLNNLNQVLYGFKAEISQYNADGVLIEKSVINHNKIVVDKNESFVPEAKLSVQFACEKVSFELLYAHYETVVWEQNKITPIAYSFDDYKNDFNNEKTNKQIRKDIKKSKKIAKHAKAEAKKIRKIRLKMQEETGVYSDGDVTNFYRKNRFKSKNITNRNKPKFPKILSVILSIAFVVITTVGIFNYGQGPISFSEGNFDFGSGGKVEAYYGDDEVVSIPMSASFTYDYTLGDYVNYGLNFVLDKLSLAERTGLPDKKTESVVITTVGKRAFANSNISEIHLPSTIDSFETDAFRNCLNLNVIEFYDNESPYNLSLGYSSLRNTGFINFEYNFVEKVDEYALSYCKNLSSIRLSNATVYKNAFVGSNNIDSLIIYDAEVEHFSDLFGGDVPLINYVKISRKVPRNFLKGLEDKVLYFSCDALDGLPNDDFNEYLFGVEEEV